MADANEVLLALYDCIREATAAASAVGQPCDDLDTVFGLPVAEHVRCGSCGLVTHATRYTQYLYNTQVRYTGGTFQATLVLGLLDWAMKV